jgi:hypothetical protein
LINQRPELQTHVILFLCFLANYKEVSIQNAVFQIYEKLKKKKHF